MIEDILPIRESGPWTINNSFNIIILEEEDIGLKIAIGNISLGNKFILIKEIKSFRKLLFTKIVTEIIKAKIEGKISKLIFSPSLTPFKNSS